MATPLRRSVLNTLRSNVNIVSVPKLSVTLPYLGKSGISISFDGDVTTQISAMGIIVQSPEPYVGATISIGILKTTGLAELYKKQIEQNTYLGDVVLTLNSDAMTEYTIINCSIKSIGEQRGDGEGAEVPVVISGTWIVNRTLWDLV